MTNVDITQTGHSAHDAVDREGVVLSSHARQDQAIETVVNVGGGEVRTAQVLRVSVSEPSEPTPEPEPDPTPEPTPEPDPEPTPDPEPPSDWQAAWDTRDIDTIRAWYRANTGPSGALTPSGSVTSTRDGQTIENLDISGSVRVKHEGVTVRNCRITGFGGGVYVAYSNRGAVSSFTVEDCALIGTEPQGDEAADNGIMATYAAAYLRRCYVSNRQGGFRLSKHDGDLAEYCMIENIRHVPPQHNTGISYRGGSGVRLTRNWIEGSTSSALSLYPDSSPITDMTARENLFDGGTYSIRAGTDKEYRDELADIKFIDNLFTRAHQYGPLAAWCSDCPGNVWTGNTYLDGQVI